MSIAISGIGVVGGFGTGLDALEAALNGRPPEPTAVAIPAREGMLAVPCLTADTAPLKRHVPARMLRRMSHYIRLGLLAAFEALIDADILESRRRLGIVVASSHGATGNNYAFQYPFNDQEEICGSPTRFANSVHNAAAGYLSIALDAMGPNHSVTHEDLSFPSALLTAVAWLREGRMDAVLVGGMDELNHAHAYAWHVHHRSTGSGGKDADHAPPAGEGACFLVLQRADAAAGASSRIREVVVGRATNGPLPLDRGDWVILGEGGVAATPGNYGRWLPEGAGAVSYAHIYGDLSVGSAFDLAIAALSRKHNRIYPGRHQVAGVDLLAGDAIACLKLGAGDTYAWTLLE